jgi:hypothetical protein
MSIRHIAKTRLPGNHWSEIIQRGDAIFVRISGMASSNLTKTKRCRLINNQLFNLITRFKPS